MLLPEGRWLVGSSAAVALWAAASGRGALAGGATVLALGAAWIFRDPERAVPPAPRGVVSPADARVAAVGEVEDPFVGRHAVHVELCMGPWGSYVLRVPVEGKVVDITHRRFSGRGCNEPDDACPDTGLWLRTDEGEDVVMVLPGGLGLRRPVVRMTVGERVGQGQRCGHVRFGSRIDLLLPPGTKVAVRPGQRLRGGSDLVGELVREAAGAVPA